MKMNQNERRFDIMECFISCDNIIKTSLLMILMHGTVELCKGYKLKMALTLPLRKGLYFISRKEGERLNVINRRVFTDLLGNSKNTTLL